MIEGCEPLIAPHFNLTVEMPLKAIVRGYSWTVVPITWRNRRFGDAEIENQGNGQPLLLHLPLRLAGKIFQPRRLQETMSFPPRTIFLNPRNWLLAGLLLLPFMVTNDSLWIDEGDTAMYAMQPDFHSWWHHLRQDSAADCQMPLSMLFAWIGGRMLGTQEWQLRVVNLVWGVLALIAMYRAGRRLQLPWLPLLLAVQPYFWFYMNEARPYALEIACGSWLLTAFVEFHVSRASGESWAWLLVTAAFFLFLSTLLAPLPVVVSVAVGVVAAWRGRWKPSRKAVLILLGGVAANVPTAIYYVSTLFRGAKRGGNMARGFEVFRLRAL